MSGELLEQYIQSGKCSALKELLSREPNLATTKTSFNISPLMLSCYYKQADITSILLEHVKEPDIFEAAAVGQFSSLTSLVYKYPEQINSYSDDGFTPLGLAVYFGHEEIARFLILKGAEVNIHSENGYRVYPIHSSVASNNLDITKILLEAGADVNVTQSLGLTPLHSAAHNGQVETIILLLEAGANVKAKAENGKTPADLALEKGHKEIGKILSE